MKRHESDAALQAACCHVLGALAFRNPRQPKRLPNFRTPEAHKRPRQHLPAPPVSHADLLVLLEEQNGLRQAIACMEHHQANLQLQLEACRAIGYLAQNVRNEQQAIKLGCVKLVVKAMTTFSRDPMMQEKGCLVLWALSRPQDTRGQLAEDGVRRRVVSVWEGDDAFVYSPGSVSMTMRCVTRRR